MGDSKGRGVGGGAVAAALALHRSGRVAEAERLYRQVLEGDPGNAEARHLLGVAALQQGRAEEAVDLIGEAAKRLKNNPQLHNNLGEAYRALGRMDEAAGCYRRAIALDRRDPAPHNNLGNVLAASGKVGEAAASYRRALKITPDDPEVLTNLGDALRQCGKAEEAIAQFERALAVAPGFVEAHVSLGRALKDLNRLAESEAACRRAVELTPGHPGALGALGTVLAARGDLAGAVASYRRAVAAAPDDATALINLGNALSEQGRLDDAIACFRRAVAAAPDDARAHDNLAVALFKHANLAEAIAHHRRAFAIDPDFAEAAGNLLYRLLQASAWAEFEKLKPAIVQRSNALIARGRRAAVNPLLSVMIDDDPATNLAVARSWSADIVRRTRAGQAALPTAGRKRGRNKKKLTVGYLSGDFRNHPVAHLTGALYGLHDRHDFAIHAYSYGRDDGSAYRKRIERDCDCFRDVRGLSFADAARRVFDDEIDLLIDLSGYTNDARLEICAYRPAPVQATYLGFPGTLGADFIDYAITDKIVTPEEHHRHYAEALVLMPACYQINDHNQEIPSASPTRKTLGLPEDGFVFCSFNRNDKIEPVMFGAWMRILKRVPGAVLWLLEANALAVDNLRREAETRGVDSGRLVFGRPLPKKEHLARMRIADLALDTRIYNGHTTTSDALWTGVPVVTLEGGHFASRVSGSLLRAMGLPELIAGDLDGFEALAVRLAENPDELRKIKQRLAGNRATSPVFDTPRFVRDLEKAYRRMWEIYRAGERPRSIDVAALR